MRIQARIQYLWLTQPLSSAIVGRRQLGQPVTVNKPVAGVAHFQGELQAAGAYTTTSWAEVVRRPRPLDEQSVRTGSCYLAQQVQSPLLTLDRLTD